MIGVFHYSKELTRTHGVPFKFVVKRGEKFSDTKARLQARLAVSDKEFAKYRFSLVQVATFKQPSPIEDGTSRLGTVAREMFIDGSVAEDTIYDHQFAPEDALGLDHVDKSGRARAGAGERAIVIRG